MYLELFNKACVTLFPFLLAMRKTNVKKKKAKLYNIRQMILIIIMNRAKRGLSFGPNVRKRACVRSHVSDLMPRLML